MAREQFKDVDALIDAFNEIKGKSLKEIKSLINVRFPAIGKILVTNKGIVGQLLEGYIGNPPNSKADSDVDEIGVELKVLPIRKMSKGLQPKERSKIKSIDYNELAELKWKDSKVRKKMGLILFLVYEQPVGLSYKDWEDEGFKFKGPLLYVLEEQSEEQVGSDYHILHLKTKQGQAHLISEGDTRILGAATSGTGNFVRYLGGKEAKQRSYVLKQPFLKQFYQEEFEKKKYISISKNIPNSKTPQEYIRDLLGTRIAGKTLGQIAKELKVELDSDAKSISRNLINKLLKVDDKVMIRELESSGVTLKTVPVNEKGVPYESMSFPKFSLADVIEEYWEGMVDNNDESIDGTNVAAFREIIERPFIFIPIIKRKISKKWEPIELWKIGEPVLWEPTKRDMDIIREQWEKVKSIAINGVDVREVKRGESTRKENNLIKASDEKIIHVRPKGKDSKDLDIPYKNLKKIDISWQCFWLNAKFVEGVLKRKSS